MPPTETPRNSQRPPALIQADTPAFSQTSMDCDRSPSVLKSVIAAATSCQPQLLPPSSRRQRRVRWLAVAAMLGIPFGAVLALTTTDQSAPSTASEVVVTGPTQSGSATDSTSSSGLSEAGSDVPEPARDEPASAVQSLPATATTPPTSTSQPTPGALAAPADSSASAKQAPSFTLFGFPISGMNPAMPHGKNSHTGSPFGFLMHHQKPGSTPGGKGRSEHHHRQNDR